jgi:hypothetical protein
MSIKMLIYSRKSSLPFFGYWASGYVKHPVELGHVFAGNLKWRELPKAHHFKFSTCQLRVSSYRPCNVHAGMCSGYIRGTENKTLWVCLMTVHGTV